MIDHGTGVVIGETATIGDNCSFLHGVTLGSTGKDKNDRHPKIGNDVLIGCNATLLGNISIGDSCKIGSGSLVLKPLPAGVTAVGNPARIIGRSMCAHAGEEMDTAMDNVVNAKGVKFSDTYNVWADSEADMFYI
jgi:serine O-acetyltransferase